MKRKFFAVLLALISAGNGVAFAASSDKDGNKACRHDAFRLCSSEIPDKEKIEACMKEHYDQLSPPCKKMFQSSSSDNDGK
ncbi:hypothetical protein [Paraburkholderia sp. 2C]